MGYIAESADVKSAPKGIGHYLTSPEYPILFDNCLLIRVNISCLVLYHEATSGSLFGEQYGHE